MAYEQVQKPSSSVVPVQKKVSGFAPPASRVQAKDVTAGEQEQMPLGTTPATDANWLMKHPLFKGNGFLQRVVAPASESESLASEESLAQRETVQRQEEGKETGSPYSLPVQAKLTIGEPGDKYEQEADRVAADVVQRIHAPAPKTGGEGAVQRLEMGEEEEVMQKSEAVTHQPVEISQLKTEGIISTQSTVSGSGIIQRSPTEVTVKTNDFYYQVYVSKNHGKITYQVSHGAVDKGYFTAEELAERVPELWRQLPVKYKPLFDNKNFSVDEPEQPDPMESYYDVEEKRWITEHTKDEYFDPPEKFTEEQEEGTETVSTDVEYFDATDEGYEELTREEGFLQQLKTLFIANKKDGSLRKKRVQLLENLQNIPLGSVPPTQNGLLQELGKSLKTLQTNDVALDSNKIGSLQKEASAKEMLKKLTTLVNELIQKNPIPKNTETRPKDKNKENYDRRKEEKEKKKLMTTPHELPSEKTMPEHTPDKTGTGERKTKAKGESAEPKSRKKSGLLTIPRSELSVMDYVEGKIALKGIKDVETREGVEVVKKFLKGELAEGRWGHAHLSGGSNTFMWHEDAT